MRKEQSLYKKLVVFRIINAFLVQSFGHPDEFWQSVEVAHNNVFGYGYLTWEWSNKDPIRNPVYPGFFSVFYFLLKYFGLDHPWIIAYGPKILNAFIAALFDLYFYKLASYFTKIQNVWFWCVINYSCWYSLYSIPRTLINVTEAVLFMIAYFFWTKSFESKDILMESISRALIVLNFIIRPTSLVIWAPIWINESLKEFSFKQFFVFCAKCLINCIAMISLSILVDSIYFGKPTWTAFNFVKFNVLEDKSALYGIYNPLWYFIGGIPLITLFGIPFLLIGLLSQLTSKRKVVLPFILILTEVLFLSLNPHKEDRFLMKLLPFLIMYIGIGVKIAYSFLKNHKTLWKAMLFTLFLGNWGYFYYASLIDKRGAIDVMDYMRKNININDSIFMLTECHRTPFYSYIHKEVAMDFPHCSPYETNPISDSRLLFVHPHYFINKKLKDFSPSHLITYSQFLEEKKVQELLEEEGYKEVQRFFNSLYVDTPVGYFSWHELVVMSKL